MMLLHFTLSCHHSLQMTYLLCQSLQHLTVKILGHLGKKQSSAEAVRIALADAFQQSSNNTKEIEPQDVAESEPVNYQLLKGKTCVSKLGL